MTKYVPMTMDRLIELELKFGSPMQIPAEAREMLQEIKWLRKATVEIARHVHNDYYIVRAQHPHDNEAYATGITDGHRCAATIARKALGEEVSP